MARSWVSSRGLTILLYEARDAAGNEEVDYLEASTFSEAQRLLRERGLSSVRLYGDPLLPTGFRRDIPPRTALRLQRRPADWRFFARVLLGSGFASLCWAGLISGVASALGWSHEVFVPLAVLALVMYLALYAAPPFAYERARRCIAWHDYRSALPLVRYVRRAGWITTPREVQVLLRFEEAAILSGLGRLEDAEALVAPLASGTEAERGVYERHRARLYDHARDFVRMRTLQREVARAHADEVVPWLDVAMTELLRFEDHLAAGRALAQADALPANELALGYAHLVRSMCQLGQGDPVLALDSIAAARAKIWSAGPPALLESIGALVDWQDACASFAAGDTRRGDELLSRCRPILLATGELDLLDRAARWRSAMEDNAQ